MQCAPIGVLAYNRPQHLELTLRLLANNHLASRSDLYIFSDASSQRPCDAAVAEVRAVARRVSGFHTVTVIEADENKQVFQATVDAIHFLSQKAEAFILVEDDISSHPLFLTFMNEALIFYKDQQDVWAICGNSYQQVMQRVLQKYEYLHDVIYSQAFYGWGWATWRDKISRVDWSSDPLEYYQKLSPRQKSKIIAHSWGEAIAAKTASQSESQLWDVRLCINMAMHDAWALFPCVNYTTTHGFDGSGIHQYDFPPDLFQFKLDLVKPDITLSYRAQAPLAMHWDIFWGVSHHWMRGFIGNCWRIVSSKKKSTPAQYLQKSVSS